MNSLLKFTNNIKNKLKMGRQKNSKIIVEKYEKTHPVMNMNVLNELKERAFSNALKKGFHNKPYSDEHYLMLVITELSEAVEAHRKGKRAAPLLYSDILEKLKCKFDKHAFDAYIKDTLEDELADSIIRLLDYSGLKEKNFDSYEFCPELFDVAISSDFEYGEFPKVVFHLTERLFQLFRSIENPLLIDTMIFLICNVARHMNIDVWKFVKLKMEYNEYRQPLHGKMY